MNATPCIGRLSLAKRAGGDPVAEAIFTAWPRVLGCCTLIMRGWRSLMMRKRRALDLRAFRARAGIPSRLNLPLAITPLVSSPRPEFPCADPIPAAEFRRFADDRGMPSMRDARRHPFWAPIAFAVVPDSSADRGRSPSGKGVHAS